MSETATTPVTTTNATPVNIPLIPIQADRGMQLNGFVLAMSTTGAMRSWTVIRNGRRIGAAAAELIGAGVTLLNETTAGFAPTIALAVDASNVVNVVATGIAATTIRWSVFLEYYEIHKP